MYLLAFKKLGWDLLEQIESKRLQTHSKHLFSFRAQGLVERETQDFKRVVGLRLAEVLGITVSRVAMSQRSSV